MQTAVQKRHTLLGTEKSRYREGRWDPTVGEEPCPDTCDSLASSDRRDAVSESDLLQLTGCDRRDF